MEKLNLLFSAILLTLISTLVYAQAPESFNYQAVLRDADGNIIANQSVTMEFAIRNGSATGSIQYNEEKVLITNEFGLVNHAVGTGTVISGNFGTITWDASPKFLRVRLDNGGGPVTLNTQQLLSVPYAIHSETAQTAESLVGGIPSSGWNISGNTISNSNSGNVGIGTSSPIQKLDVNGRMNVTNGVIQRGGSTITSTNDLGLYSRVEGNWMRFSTNDAHIRFYTNEADGIGSGGFNPTMTIAPSENVGIGVAEPDSRLHVIGSSKMTGGYMRVCTSADNSQGNVGIGSNGFNNTKLDVTSNQDYGLYVNAPNAPQWSLYVNGSAAKPGGGSWVAASDARLKENVQPYADGLAKILEIKPVSFHYNERSGLNTSKEYIGVIAQELQEVAPYMVGQSQMSRDDEQEYLNVDNSAMTYMLINAVKEQQEQIDALKAEIEALKNK